MKGLAQGRTNPARDAAREAKRLRMRRSPASREVDRMREGLKVLHAALNDDPNNPNAYWEARKFIRVLGAYDGDLHGEALLAEVARLALDLPAELPPALTKVVR